MSYAPAPINLDLDYFDLRLGRLTRALEATTTQLQQAVARANELEQERDAQAAALATAEAKVADLQGILDALVDDDDDDEDESDEVASDELA